MDSMWILHLESSAKEHTSQLQVERLELARQVAACAGILEDDFQDATFAIERPCPL